MEENRCVMSWLFLFIHRGRQGRRPRSRGVAVAEREAPVRWGTPSSQPGAGVCSELDGLSTVAGDGRSTAEVRTLLSWHADGSGRGGERWRGPPSVAVAWSQTMRRRGPPSVAAPRNRTMRCAAAESNELSKGPLAIGLIWAWYKGLCFHSFLWSRLDRNWMALISDWRDESFCLILEDLILSVWWSPSE